VSSSIASPLDSTARTVIAADVDAAIADKTVADNKEAVRRRFVFLKWLRKIHGWVGLWGALLGLLFGFTGILQNHRAVMKIKLPAPVVSNIQIAAPNPLPASPKEMGEWLQQELKLERGADKIQREESQTVTWGDQTVVQPEHWVIRFIAPNNNVQADYWLGANFIKVQRTEPGLLGVMNNFHKASGASIGWILLADTIGGAMILLSITGVILWTELNRRRTIGVLIVSASTIAMLLFGTGSL
jgi:uncharacterized protein